MAESWGWWLQVFNNLPESRILSWAGLSQHSCPKMLVTPAHPSPGLLEICSVALPEGLTLEGPVWSPHSPKTCWRPCLGWGTNWHRGWDMGRGLGRSRPAWREREKGPGNRWL